MQLLEAGRKAIGGAGSFQEEHGSEGQEIEDRAQDAARDEPDQLLQDADARRLRNVERALRKIDEGTYGYSDLSGEPIPKARLEAEPEATLTVEEERRAEEK